MCPPHLHCELHPDGMSRDRDVLSLPHDLGLVEREEELLRVDLGGDVEAHAVHKLVLEEHNGVGVANGGLGKKYKVKSKLNVYETTFFFTFSSPLQSSESYGLTTFSPGQWAYQAAKHCECC